MAIIGIIIGGIIVGIIGRKALVVIIDFGINLTKEAKKGIAAERRRK